MANKLLKELEKEGRNLCYGQVLPYRQRRLVMLYDGSNTAELARKLKVSQATIQKWLTDGKVQSALSVRDTLNDSYDIADRIERKEFWTAIMYDESADLKDRLKASELLGKSECDFSETRVLKGVGQGTTVIINTGVPRAPDDPDIEIKKVDPEGIEDATVLTLDDIL